MAELERVLGSRGDPWAVLNLDPHQTWAQVKAASGGSSSSPQEGPVASGQAEAFARIVRKAYRHALARIHPDRLSHTDTSDTSQSSASAGLSNLISEGCSLVSDAREKLLAGGVATLAGKTFPSGVAPNQSRKREREDGNQPDSVQAGTSRTGATNPPLQHQRRWSEAEVINQRKAAATLEKRKTDALGKVEERRKKELEAMHSRAGRKQL